MERTAFHNSPARQLRWTHGCHAPFDNPDDPEGKGPGMDGGFISRAFRGRRVDPELAGRIPPGQYLERGFPVLSAGPTPHTPLERWDLRVDTDTGESRRWTWAEFTALPRETFTVDIHCVTKWTKLDTEWAGVSLDTLLDGLADSASYLIAHCDGGYTTNLPIEDVTGGKAWIAFEFEGEELEPAHGGPARLLIPHLYFWKSAKWVRRLELVDDDRPGFWEELGYHNYGDPWQEQRYQGD
jgi:DMSO/TMAO reductase YedYZ molybdopterin-dependent catalytic subunit